MAGNIPNWWNIEVYTSNKLNELETIENLRRASWKQQEKIEL